ncbi:MAG: prealbumin-like fold domain-containing protein, partial [Christensenellaceae bacterium]
MDANKQVLTFDVIFPQPAAITEIQTDTSGTVHLPNKLVSGQYYLREIQAPQGYLLSTEDIPFEILPDGSQAAIVNVQLSNIPAMGTVSITKTVDEFAGIENLQPLYKTIPLENTKFEVVAADNIVTPDGTIRANMGDVVDVITTDVNGTAKSKPLHLGAYFLRETEVHPFELLYQDQHVPVVDVELFIENVVRKLNVSFTKTAETMLPDKIGYTYNEAAGFAFGLYAAKQVAVKDGTVLLNQD